MKNYFAILNYCVYLHPHYQNAGVVELVDTPDLGHSEIKTVKIFKCGRGGIGRHVRLRI